MTLCALHADVDFYNLRTPIASLTADAVTDLILAHLTARNIPDPHLILATGRGLGLIWLIDPIPAKAHARWRACQQRLRDELAPFGHDAAAIDACRLTRIVGTINSANSNVVHMLRCSAVKRYDFDTLADRLLPHTRAEIIDLKAKRHARKAKKALGRSSTYNQRSFHQAILADVRKFVVGRYGGQAPPRRRNEIVLIAANSLSFLTPPERLRDAIVAVGAELAGWSASVSLTCAASVITRAGRRARNPIGREPRYRYSVARIVANLSITEDEMRHFDLRVLRSKTIEQERDRNRKAAERRAAGRATR